MNHLEILIMNEIRKTLENLQRTGVGYINLETNNTIEYNIDDKSICVCISNKEK